MMVEIGGGVVVVAVDQSKGVGNTTDVSSGHEEAPSVEDDANTTADVSKIVKTTPTKKPPNSPTAAAKQHSDELRKPHKHLEHAHRRATSCIRCGNS